jgi:hypothetical protein
MPSHEEYGISIIEETLVSATRFEKTTHQKTTHQDSSESRKIRATNV